MDSFAQARRHGRWGWQPVLLGTLVLATFGACGRTNGNGGYIDGDGGEPSAPGGVASVGGTNGQGGSAQGGTSFVGGAPGGGRGEDAGAAGVAGSTEAGGAGGEGGTSAGEGGGGVASGGQGGAGGEGGAVEPAEPCVLRVKPTGSDMNDGSSWTEALATLEGAMRASYVNPSNQTCQVWVAEGTYAPIPWSRESFPTLRVPPRTEIYGGFFGTESTLAERAGSGERTIVTGLRDAMTPRLRPVLTTEDRVRLDRLTIRDGESPAPGGGVACETGELLLSEVMVTENSGADGGGLLVTTGCSVRVEASTFQRNYASVPESVSGGRGAGIANFGGRLVVRGGHLTANQATARGGGVYTTGNTELEDVELVANQARSQLGPAAGAGIYAEGTSGAVTTLRDCTVHHNEVAGSPAYGAGVAGSALVISGSEVSRNYKRSNDALYGAGIYATGSLTLEDSTVAENRGGSGVIGGGLYFEQGELRVRRTTFDANSGMGGAHLHCGAGCRGRISALFRGRPVESAEAGVSFEGETLDLVNSLFAGQTYPLLRVDAPNGAARVIHSTFLFTYVRGLSPVHHLAGTLAVESSVMSSTGVEPNVVPVQIRSTAFGGLTITKSDIVGLCGGATTCGTNWDVEPKYTIVPYPASDSIVVDAGGAPLPPDWLDLDGDGDVAELLPVDFYGNPRVAGPRSDLGAVELPP